MSRSGLLSHFKENLQSIHILLQYKYLLNIAII